MKRFLIIAMVMALALPLVLPAGVYAQTTDPASVVRAATRAYNAHDVDALIALFADDAVLTVVPGGPVFTGKEQIRKAFQGAFVLNPSNRMVGWPQVTGNNVTWTVAVSNDLFRGLGIAPLLATNEAIVQGGLFTSLTTGYTPESLARLQTARAISVVRAATRAYNAHDVEAFMALFADGAVLTVVPAGPVFTGKEQIRKAFQGAFALNPSNRMVGWPQVAGNKVTWTVAVSNDLFRKLGIAPLLATNEAIVQGGLMRSVTTGYTPESLARLQAALTAQSSK